MVDDEDTGDFSLNLLTDYHEHTVEYEGPSDGEVVRQTVLGWSQGGCEVVWSEVLPRVVARNGERFRGKRVLELGAGCGLIGLLAGQFADTVLITDGDPQEVALIRNNCAERAPAVSSGAPAVSAVHLEWGMAAAEAAAASGHLAARQSYDTILASQVVYVPANIPLLVETIDFCLAPDGEMFLYNDAVSTTSTQEACREILDKTLQQRGLCAGPVLQADGALLAPSGIREQLEEKPWAYLLRITRHASPK